MIAKLARSISSELRKITGTKTWWTLALTLLVYAAMMAAVFAFLYGEIADQAGAAAEDSALTVYSTTATFGYVIPLVYGALAATNELRHGTLGVTFTVEPRRGIVLAGKALALAVVGGVFAVAGLIGAVGAGAPLLAASDLSTMLGEGVAWGLFARVGFAIAIWVIIGFGVGLIVKNQAFAIVLAIGFTQFIEPVARLGAQFWEWSAALAKFLPGSAMDAFVGASAFNDLAAADPSMPEVSTTLGTGAGLAVLLAYAVASCATGWVLRLRADVT